MVKQVAHPATEARCLRKRANQIVNDGLCGTWTINVDHSKSGLTSQLAMISTSNSTLPPRYSMNEASRTRSKVQRQLARSLRMMRFSPAAFRHCGLPRPRIGSHLESTDPLLELSQLMSTTRTAACFLELNSPNMIALADLPISPHAREFPSIDRKA